MSSRKIKDGLAYLLVWASAVLSVSILVTIIFFIFSNGWSFISREFITNQFNEDLQFVQVVSSQDFQEPGNLADDAVFSEVLGIAVALKDGNFEIVYMDSNSPLRHGVNNAGEPFPVERGNVVEGAQGADGTVRFSASTSLAEVRDALNSSAENTLRIRVLGGGIWPLIVTTLLLVVTTLLVAAPIGILAAIYMVEYVKPGRLVNTIRFATEVLAGIPSVVYGLFGSLMFVNALRLGQSIFAASLTMTILLLPIMMRTTEEALKTVPMSYREASYGLGANKIQTISKVVLPSAIPGITVGIILSIGRIIGESAALLFTMGTFPSMPRNMTTGNISIFARGTTLTVRAFIEVKENANVEMAAAIGIVILVLVFTLNIISRLISKKFSRANY